MTIAFLSTGDEIINGDIKNTTTRMMASELFAEGFAIGHHLTVSDDDSELLSGLEFLLQTHDTVICTGGLGPTSDDRTRFALAQYFDETLYFFDECWEHIVQRHLSVGLKTHDNNRQQALFPKEAVLLPNPVGTAYGCCFSKEGKKVFLLPGPPSECMPMFKNYVLPELQMYGEKLNAPLYRWLVFNIPESELSHMLDKALVNFDVQIGYRWHYPYIELKISSKDPTLSYQLINEQLQQIIPSDHLFQDNKTAMERLLESLPRLKQPLAIVDSATRGHLESRLMIPGQQYLNFSREKSAQYSIDIQGLELFWDGDVEGQTTLRLVYSINGKQENDEEVHIQVKRRSIIPYVLELLACKINFWLKKQQLV